MIRRFWSSGMGESEVNLWKFELDLEILPQLGETFSLRKVNNGEDEWKER